MFSHEIDNYLRDKNWMLSSEEYIYVTDVTHSPQIDHIKYNPYENNFYIHTSDGFEWTIRVYKI